MFDKLMKIFRFSEVVRTFKQFFFFVDKVFLLWLGRLSLLDQILLEVDGIRRTILGGLLSLSYELGCVDDVNGKVFSDSNCALSYCYLLLLGSGQLWREILHFFRGWSDFRVYNRNVKLART